MEMLLVVEKKSRQLQNVWQDKLCENNWGLVARNEVPAESFQQKRQNKPDGREKTFLQTFLINHIQQFSIQFFCDSL